MCQVKQGFDAACRGVTLAWVGGEVLFILCNGLIEQRYCRACLARKEGRYRVFVLLRHFWRQRNGCAIYGDGLAGCVHMRRVEDLAVREGGGKRP